MRGCGAGELAVGLGSLHTPPLTSLRSTVYLRIVIHVCKLEGHANTPLTVLARVAVLHGALWERWKGSFIPAHGCSELQGFERTISDLVNLLYGG